MEKHLNSLSLNDLKKRIIEVMLYFDIFSYPMSREEIFETVNHSGVKLPEINREIDELVNLSVLFELEGFLMINENPAWVHDRKDRNQRADKYLSKAYRMGRFIGKFPFVRAVMISGSLSKHWMAEDGDVDFFIVTERKRLWIARTFLVLFKKIFLLNSHKYFCVNYFVDIDHLEIEEKNRFTATEIVTLLPVVNKDLYFNFLEQNNWVNSFYPNFPVRDTTKVSPHRMNWIKRIIEKMLGSEAGKKLDKYFLLRTLNYWNRKFTQMSKEEFEVAMKSRSYISKHHPNAFQNKVLKAHIEKMHKFEAAYLKRMPIGG